MGGEDASAESFHTRRRVLRRVGAGATAVLAGCGGDRDDSRPPRDGTETPTTDADGATEVGDGTEESGGTTTATPGGRFTDVRGAVYFPSRSFNHYQSWETYDPGEAVRDVAYASTLDLNALRVLVSYQFWRDRPQQFAWNVDHFLGVAAEQGIRILPVLFESVGVEPTREALEERDILRNGAVRSPSHEVLRDERRWDGPRRFVREFVRRYGDHEGLLAVEIMNEPGGLTPRVEFCRAMLRTARDADASVPLTMGCIDVENNMRYDDIGLDVYQFHYNLPPTSDHMREALAAADRVARATGTPVWLTEWQRTRTEPPDKMLPHYSSLAPTVRDSALDGDFFWQLMLKPAYGYVQRLRGRLNGVFHEDGRVYSLADARAISGGDGFWRSRRAWPEWARELEDSREER